DKHEMRARIAWDYQRCSGEKVGDAFLWNHPGNLCDDRAIFGNGEPRAESRRGALIHHRAREIDTVIGDHKSASRQYIETGDAAVAVVADRENLGNGAVDQPRT